MAIWSIMDVSSWGMSHPAIMKMMVLQIGWKISLSLHVLSEIQSINALLGKSSPIFREFNTACKMRYHSRCLGLAIASQKLSMILRLTAAYQHFRYDGSQEPEWAFVWSLTQLHSFSFSQSRVIMVKNYS